MCFSQHLCSHTVAMILSYFLIETVALRIMVPTYDAACRIELYACMVFYFLHSTGSLSICSQKAQLKIKKSLFTSLSSFPSLFFFPEKITVKLFSILIYLLKIKSALCKKWLSLYHFII